MPQPSPESPSPESLYLGAARHSLSSDSSSTAHCRSSILSSSECTIQVEEDYKRFDGFSITEHKPLPRLPSDPYLIEHPVSHPHQSPIPLLTTISQLASALGPDNVHHTTEIDTVPCAGIRIPHGPLTGLLAWRLVVCLASSTKGKTGWWNDTADRRASYAEPMIQSLRSHAQPYPASIPFNPSASISALSLLSSPQALPPVGGTNDFRSSSVILAKPGHLKTHSHIINRSQPQLVQGLPRLANALAVNFILDTSLPCSIISRDTLVALGYPPRLIPPPSMSHLASMSQDDKPAMVTLLIQNIPTRFHIARPNEASRLGVQFLQDAGVSVFFPKDGEGVGPVLYVESARLLKDVPRTISLQGIGTKLTLAQRVCALLGLS